MVAAQALGDEAEELLTDLKHRGRQIGRLINRHGQVVGIWARVEGAGDGFLDSEV